MKQAGLETIIHAKDIYPEWRKLLKRASSTITIFTPYFDHALVSLLQANKIVPFSAVRIITDFNEYNLLRLPNQLKAIKELLKKGVNVLTLPRLHAKVLLVDGIYVSIGSQNFTRYARTSKEVSAIPKASVEQSVFLQTLQIWEVDAEAVDPSLVEDLLRSLLPTFRALKTLSNTTNVAIIGAFAARDRRRKLARLRRLEQLELKSRSDKAQIAVFARVEQVRGEYSSYPSLITGPTSNMTKWIIQRNGAEVSHNLARLRMFPMLQTDTGRMGFIRIGKRRISYVRDYLDCSDWTFEIGNYGLGAEIRFPPSNTNKRNVIVTLENTHVGSCEAAFLFTGDSFQPVSRRYKKRSSFGRDTFEHFKKTMERRFFKSPTMRGSFFQKFFEKFTYSHLGRENKNIDEYFSPGNYRLSVIEYQSVPVLLIRPANAAKG